MQVSICMSQVQPMLDWLEALANGRADKQTLDRMLDLSLIHISEPTRPY